ncbi:MAG: outer membrane beta-barrel protein [Sphingobacteriaceae bacterium]
MKKRFIIVITCFLSMLTFLAAAQTEKGKWLLGGTLGMTGSSNKNTDSKETQFYLEPGLSYFVQKDLAIGALVRFGTYNLRQNGMSDTKTSSVYFAPTLRYYLPIAEKFKFLGQLSIPFGSEKTTLSGGNTVSIKATSVGLEITPAFAFFPSNKISIEMSLATIYFKSNKLTTDDVVKTNDFGIQVLGSNGAYPSLGFKFHLGK